jgi:hypothetical protein
MSWRHFYRVIVNDGPVAKFSLSFDEDSIAGLGSAEFWFAVNLFREDKGLKISRRYILENVVKTNVCREKGSFHSLQNSLPR